MNQKIKSSANHVELGGYPSSYELVVELTISSANHHDCEGLHLFSKLESYSALTKIGDTHVRVGLTYLNASV